jgi:hypothetical protein
MMHQDDENYAEDEFKDGHHKTLLSILEEAEREEMKLAEDNRDLKCCNIMLRLELLKLRSQISS